MTLTDTFVRSVKADLGKPAGVKHSDAYGLYLHVKSAGKYWRMAYRFAGKQKTLALGVYPEVSLAQARKRRDEAKAQIADGVDPSIDKRVVRQKLQSVHANTFAKIAEQWLKATAAERKSITQQKIQTWLTKDILPTLGKHPISTITARDVLAMARKIENRGALDSAKRIVQLVGQIFRFAVAEGSTERDVTADLRGALKTPKKKHYAAITEPKELAPLLRAIDGYTGHPYCRAALRLTPMLFVRPGELRHAEWAEIDFDLAEWRIPGSKMKMSNDHIVPLSKQAIAILQALQPLTGHGKYVFPSIRTGERPMSENTVAAALRALGYDSDTQTVHGFRATARTILDEVLGERVDWIEHQLAHTVKDANGRAYNRTAHLADRKGMMQRWSDYLDQIKRGAEVIPFQRQG